MKRKMERKLNKLRKEMEKESNEITKKWKMSKFVIVDKEIREEVPNLFNGAYDNHSVRLYISKISTSTVDFCLKEISRLSEHVKAVQIEFDQRNGKHNIELEIYLLGGNFDYKDLTHFQIVRSPCSITVSKRFYFEFIEKLKERQC
ncbi:hypothetical protein PDK03_20710 [Bacillus cereus group sp. TH204-1LC]|uniref:hypothetical protein n=1 Tax=Bacillus cereus group sp. TH204-1LC TaxID=3018054 RepID=UPI0022E4A202|nr:hypothetical protein [Bacillus cereus group sp. TH204-1LC]MDA1618978.1 hypothetical protein [Bacillus cereus group sp. TH204-1LC]